MKPIRTPYSYIHHYRGHLLAITLTSALALTACASDSKTATDDGDQPTASSAGYRPQDDKAPPGVNSQDYIAAAAYWGGVNEKNPDDVNAAVQYSKALRKIGSVVQALSVMQKMQSKHGDDIGILTESGKVLTASGKAGPAITYLDRAEAQSSKDWTVLSANGVAHDQLGRYEEAQAKYMAALKIAPGNPSILSNLGLSYALSGDLDNAEKYLREAVSNQEANATARQNLAVVMGLKGNFDEALRIAQSDLPANVAAANIAYLREMLTQPALWKQMESLDKRKARLGATDGSIAASTDRVTTSSINP